MSGKPSTKITSAYVIGSGAIGTFFAARLAECTPTYLVIREGSRSAPSGGVELRGAIQKNSDPISLLSWDEVQKFESGAIIVVASKIFDLPAILQQIKSRLDGTQSIVLCQNGVGVQELAQATLAGQDFARAVCWFGVRIEHDPATHRSVLHVAGVDSIEFSFPASAPSGHAGIFEQWMERSGIPPRPLASYGEVEWRKALWNISANGLCALAEAPNGAAAQDELLRPVADGLYEEAAAVARARGVHLAADVKERCFAGMVRTGTNLNSTLMDLRAGRRTEMDWLNGAVVRWADELGLPCPHNRTVVNVVRYLERHQGRKRG